MSVCGVSVAPGVRCSGAMYIGVPAVETLPDPVCTAMPKSVIRTRPC
jgi:hypothetical protein